MHFIWLWMLDIYIVEKYIQLYIIYGIQEPLGRRIKRVLLEWEHNVYLSSSKEVEVVSWGCLAEQPQSCSSSLFGECHFSYSPESESLWRSQAIDASADRYSSARTPWCQWFRALRAGPSGEERCTPHYTVPVSPQCPQEISLLTLPVFQGAAVSSERFSQSLLPRNVAELGGSPLLRGSLEQLDRPSPAGPPLQGTELAALSTPEASLKRLVPLVSHLAVWEPLPSMSYWVLPEQTLVL